MNTIYSIISTVFDSVISWMNSAGLSSVGFGLFAFILSLSLSSICLRYLLSPALISVGSDRSKGSDKSKGVKRAG